MPQSEADDLEKRSERALGLIAMLSFHLRLHPGELPALRPQIQGLKNTLSGILIAPTDAAMSLLETQIDTALASLDQPNRTIN